MKTILKVLLVVVVAGTIAMGWILANGGSDVGLAKDIPTLESQAGPSHSAKEILLPLESQSGAGRVLRDPLPPFPTVFECFLTTPGITQNKPVWLTTNNFGNDFVRVQRLALLCEGAVKTGPTAVRFPMSGAQEVPPAATPATGDCTGVLSADQSSFQVDCTHDVAGANATHIHRGAAGIAGPIIIGLGSPASPISFTWDAGSTPPLTAADVADLLAGDLYVNVHSPAFPGGEVRGQIPFTGPSAPIGSLVPPVVYACYLVAEGRVSDDPFELFTTNFGPDDVRIENAVVMCESARKTLVDSPGIPPTGHPGEHVLELFNIADGIIPAVTVTLETINFGQHPATVLEAVVMMEEAIKMPPPPEPTTGEATGRVWECFMQDAPTMAPRDRPPGNGEFPAGTGAGGTENRDVRGGREAQGLPGRYPLIWRLDPATVQTANVNHAALPGKCEAKETSLCKNSEQLKPPLCEGALYWCARHSCIQAESLDGRPPTRLLE